MPAINVEENVDKDTENICFVHVFLLLTFTVLVANFFFKGFASLPQGVFEV